jgi:hypothetical protein
MRAAIRLRVNAATTCAVIFAPEEPSQESHQPKLVIRALANDRYWRKADMGLTKVNDRY